MVTEIGVLCAMQASAQDAHGLWYDLVKVAQGNGCQMVPKPAREAFTNLKLEPKDAGTMIGNLIAEGILAFDSEDKTLLLLPPECKA